MPNISTDRIREFLNIYWLRPECALFDAIAASVIQDELVKGENILELGIGNGIFSFMTLGGKFHEDYDWFYNVDTRGFFKNKDIYDTLKTENISDFIIAPPAKRLKIALDHKQSLLDQAVQLDFVDDLVLHDCNIDFHFDNIDTIFTNILYWLNEPSTVLRRLGQKLAPNGKIILVCPNSRFTEHCRSYKRESPIWDLLNRGRADSLMWTMDLEDIEQHLSGSTLRLAHAETYLCRQTLQIWDIGLRPISPFLIDMSQAIERPLRARIKRDWCDYFMNFFGELLDHENDKGPIEGGFNFIVLEKES